MWDSCPQHKPLSFQTGRRQYIGLLLEIDAFANFNILLVVMIWQNHANGDIWVCSWQLIYVLRRQENADCVSREDLEELCRVQAGWIWVPLVWHEHHLWSSQGHIQDVGPDFEGQKHRGGVQPCEDSDHCLSTSFFETRLSWHSNVSQGTFLFLRCNNLTKVDEMKCILEPFSIPVRLDHDRNILSCECLNVVVKVSRDSSPSPRVLSKTKRTCFYQQGHSGFLQAMRPFNQHLYLLFPPQQSYLSLCWHLCLLKLHPYQKKKKKLDQSH